MHPLTSLEVTAIQEIVNTNVLGKTLMLAFSQVATTQKLRSYFLMESSLQVSKSSTSPNYCLKLIYQVRGCLMHM